MNTEEIQKKQEIQSALAQIPTGDFLETIKALLSVLGYRSQRTGTFWETVDEFIETLPARNQNTNTEQEFRAEAKSVELVFQITDDEINTNGQGKLFESPAFDEGNAKSFIFFAVKLKAKDYPRTKYAQFTREINKRLIIPVVVLFSVGDRLTIGFVGRRPHKGEPHRNVLEQVTLIKDIQLDTPHRAHLDILFELSLEECAKWMDANNQPETFDGLLAAWLARLDTEALNKQFYQKLFNWFEWAVAEAKFPTNETRVLKPEEHVIRLITRLLFVWFIKEKGLVAEALFNEAQISPLLKAYDRESGDSYYRAVLQNLFFATLNTEINKREFSPRTNAKHRNFSVYRYKDQLNDSDQLLALFAQTPFINGGLFDCLDSEEATRDGGYRIDCFSDEHYDRLSIPNHLFFDEVRGLIPLLKHYKFTVQENTPIEQEVALDPELLGKVFENLLAAYNPETGATARKQTGSYYTPRPIVDYMVEEALVATLAGQVSPTDGDTKTWEARLRILFDYAQVFDAPVGAGSPGPPSDDTPVGVGSPNPPSDNTPVGAGSPSPQDSPNPPFDPRESDAIVRAISELKILDPAVGSGAFPMGVLHKLTLALSRLDPNNKRWESLQKERAGQRATAAFDTQNQRQRDAELTAISDIFERYRDSDFGRKLYLIQNSIFGLDIQSIACQIAKLRFFISLAVEQEPDVTADNFGIKPLPNLETRFIASNTLIGLESERTLTSSKAKTLETQLGENRERHFHATTRSQKRACKRADRTLRRELAKELKSVGMPADDAEKIALWDPYDQNGSADWFDPEWMFGVADGFDVVIGNPPYVVSKDKQLRKIYSESVYGRPNLYGYFIHRVLQDLLASNGILIFINPRTLLTDAYCSALRTFVLKHSQICSVLNIVDRRNVFESVLQSCIVNSFQKTNTRIPIRVKNIFRKEDISDANWIEISQDDFLFEQNNVPLFIIGNHHSVYGIFRKLKMLKSFKTHGLSFTTGKIQWDLYKSVLGDVPIPTATRLIWAENVQRYHYSEARKRADRIYINAQLEKCQPITHDTIIVQRTTAVEQERRIIAHLFSPDSFGYPIQAENHTSYLTEAEDVPLKFVLGILNSKFIDFIFRHINSNTQVSAGELNSLPFPDSEASTRNTISKLADQILTTKRTHPNADVSNLENEIDKMVYLLYDLTTDEIAIVEEKE